MRKSIALIGGLAAATAMMSAGAVASSTKPTAALNATGVRRARSYRKRLELMGGDGHRGRSAYVTKGNRAQRRRQLNGMIAKNG